MAKPEILSLHDATVEMIVTYHELNGDIDELNEEPSPLEFMRYVSKNRPFVVRGGCSHWVATRQWNVEYLRSQMGHNPIQVAETPHGNADSVVRSLTDGLRYFAKPREKGEPFSDFLHFFTYESNSIKYSQARKYFLPSKNDNLRNEYSPLLPDVERDISWASIALLRKPDAVNLWLGSDLSTTALHRDNYENIYCQIIGAKSFVLLAPVETACVSEQFLPSATYDNDLRLVPDDPEKRVPCAVWDPDKPQGNATELSHLSQPIRVRVGPGDMLYLPACWYHKVSQENSSEGLCCSVNYWYDMDFDGTFHASNAFIRNLAWAAADPGEL